MATAGGLIIGAVGLGTLYTTCVECYTVFHKIRAFTRNAGYLASKLETENALFRQWGERVGLLSGRQQAIDPQLRDPWTRKAVEGVLLCIHILLTDTDKFQTTYGLVPFEPNNEMNGTRSSGSKQVRRYSQPHSWPSNETGPERKHVNLLRKFHWSILDQEKFSDLISELRDLVQRLNELIPAKEGPPEPTRSSGGSEQLERNQRKSREQTSQMLIDTRKQYKPQEIMPPPYQFLDRSLTTRPKSFVEKKASPQAKEIWHVEDCGSRTTHRYYRIS